MSPSEGALRVLDTDFFFLTESRIGNLKHRNMKGDIISSQVVQEGDEEEAEDSEDERPKKKSMPSTPLTNPFCFTIPRSYQPVSISEAKAPASWVLQRLAIPFLDQPV